MTFFVLKKRTIILFLAVLTVVASAAAVIYTRTENVTAFSPAAGENARDIHMVTGEFTTKTADGKEMEVYRWDPGTIFVEKGENVNLKILGVNGSEHPFYIEGTDIKGVVKKGEETVVPLNFAKEGTYKLICNVHSHHENHGTMIAYIVVD